MSTHFYFERNNKEEISSTISVCMGITSLVLMVGTQFPLLYFQLRYPMIYPIEEYPCGSPVEASGGTLGMTLQDFILYFGVYNTIYFVGWLIFWCCVFCFRKTSVISGFGFFGCLIIIMVGINKIMAIVGIAIMSYSGGCLTEAPPLFQLGIATIVMGVVNSFIQLGLLWGVIYSVRD